MKGTEYAAMIDRQAPAQRSGVLASLNMVADTLKLFRQKTKRRAMERGGVVETAEGLAFPHEHARNAQAPLFPYQFMARHAGVAIHEQGQGQTSSLKVWFVLDELATLQRLPQLHTAITENRKSNNPVVLGFQGRSQLETRYGHEAEAMLHNPPRRFSYARARAHAAKWISEHYRKDRDRAACGRAGQRADGAGSGIRRATTMERDVVPLVMDSEISGLEEPTRVSQERKPCGADELLIHRIADEASEVHRATAGDPPQKHPKQLRPRRELEAGGRNKNSHSNEIKQDREQELKRSSTWQGHFFRVGQHHDADYFQPTECKPGTGVSRGRILAMPARTLHEGDQIRGQWHGGLASSGGSQCGRRGTFPAADRRATPDHWRALVRHQAARQYVNERGEKTRTMAHRAGWDATFSAPKSVSLTALVGGDEGVRGPISDSVAVALDEGERYVQARIGGNHPAETTGRWITAEFEHDSARPVDGYAAPQLHTHVVVFNVTETERGGDPRAPARELYKSQQDATAVYRSELATRLKALGYEIDRGAERARRKSRVTPKRILRRRVLVVSRSKRISPRENQRGTDAAQIAAHRTRQPKREHAQERCTSGIADSRKPTAMSRPHCSRRSRGAWTPRSRRNSSPVTTARSAVTLAKARNFEREAVVDERDLLRDALRRSMGQANAAEFGRSSSDA